MSVPARPGLSRREFALVALGLVGSSAVLAACADGADAKSTDGTDDSDESDATEGSEADTEGTDTEGTAAGGWATGGTAAMTGDYADPFTDVPEVCALACAMTLGPCYGETIDRKDVSEGNDGLPVRLAFKVVDEDCKPVAGASVDIWHTAPNGIYSGDDVSDFCTSGDLEAEAGKWFRGLQTADSDGRVDFDTCFPGWYPGRAIHIHLTVRVGETKYVTTQLFFPQALINEVFDGHPVYKPFGAPNTPNASDGIAKTHDIADYTFETAQMDDGAMLAWKTLVIRGSLDDKAC